MAQNATLYVDQGCTYRALLTLKSVSALFDLTGCSAEMTIRPNYGSNVVWLTLTSAPGGGLVLGGAAGTLQIALTPQQTGAFPVPAAANQQVPVGRAVFDIAITLANGDVVRCLQGSISVTAAITLPTGTGGPQ